MKRALTRKEKMAVDLLLLSKEEVQKKTEDLGLPKNRSKFKMIESIVNKIVTEPQ